MAKFKFELNRDGVKALLKSQEMQDVLSSYAEEVQGRAGGGYEHDTYMAGTRVIASVFTEDAKSFQDNLENNTLLRSLK